jgi:hypothetical protein
MCKDFSYRLWLHNLLLSGFSLCKNIVWHNLKNPEAIQQSIQETVDRKLQGESTRKRRAERWKTLLPYRLGFSPQPQKNILVSHSRINPAPWKYLIYTNPQGFLPDRLQNTPKIPVFQSRTPKINRYFSCAQSPRRAKNDIFARWYKVCTVDGGCPHCFLQICKPGSQAVSLWLLFSFWVFGSWSYLTGLIAIQLLCLL